MPLPLVPIAAALAQLAPSLMRYFGAGESSAVVAEKVVAIAQSVSGAATPEEALAALRADAVARAEFERRSLELDAELEREHLGDRQDARRRDVALAGAGRHNARADLMVCGAVLGLISCLVALVFFKVGMPGEVVGIISTVAGIFGACLRDAFQFEFGSSRGSREKDELLAQLGAAGVPSPKEATR